MLKYFIRGSIIVTKLNLFRLFCLATSNKHTSLVQYKHVKFWIDPYKVMQSKWVFSVCIKFYPQYCSKVSMASHKYLIVLSLARWKVICTHQPWARYLEGDNILTKIGSSRVEIEIGEASPIFQEIEIGIGEALVKSRVGSGASGFYSRGVETSRDNSRSRGKTRLSRFPPEISSYPDFFLSG